MYSITSFITYIDLQVLYDQSVILENGTVVDTPFMIMSDLTSNSRISRINSWSLCSAKVYKNLLLYKCN